MVTSVKGQACVLTLLKAEQKKEIKRNRQHIRAIKRWNNVGVPGPEKHLPETHWRLRRQIVELGRGQIHVVPETPRDQITEVTKELLLVVHAQVGSSTGRLTGFDELGSAAAGVNRVISEFRNKGAAMVGYLMDSFSLESQLASYVRHFSPDFAYQSSVGWHSKIWLRHPAATVVGGFWGGCHMRGMLSLFKNYQLTEPLHITLPMDAIYFRAFQNLEDIWELEEKKPERFLRHLWNNYLPEHLKEFNYDLRLKGELVESRTQQSKSPFVIHFSME